MAALSYVMVFVSDMDCSVTFYRDVVGLTLSFASPHWSEFSTGGTTLALHPAAPRSAATPEKPTAGGAQIGIAVDDLDAFHQQMIDLGVHCAQPPKDENFGARIARYHDPDGLPFSVSARKK